MVSEEFLDGEGWVAFHQSMEEGVDNNEFRSFCEYRQEMLPRYKMNVSLETISYFVVDTPLYGFEPGKDIAEIVKTQWLLVYSIGDYAVYRNLKLHQGDVT